MALSVVTATTTRLRANSGASVSGNLLATPSVGNLLAGGLVSFNVAPSAFTLTDNHSNTYNRLVPIENGTGSAVAQFYAKNSVGTGTFTMTATFGAGAPGGECFVYEAAGPDTTAPFTTGESNTHTGSGTAPTTGATPTLSNATSILFALVANDFSGSDTATMTAGTGWTMDATNGRDIQAQTFFSCGFAYQIVSSTAAVTGSFTTSTGNYAACIVAYGAAGTGTTDPFPAGYGHTYRAMGNYLSRL